jgi:hypothetical protein
MLQDISDVVKSEQKEQENRELDRKKSLELKKAHFLKPKKNSAVFKSPMRMEPRTKGKKGESLKMT